LSSRRKRSWIIWVSAVFLFVVGYQVLSRVYLEENKRIRTRIRERVEQTYPDAANEMRAMYGIKPADGQGPAAGGEAEIRNVILIHGLDDPGKVWMELSPRLIHDGFNVWIMSYPNDQPIWDSARLFFEEMEALRRKGIGDVSIVAHSMGGLVAREMLSNPEFSYGKIVLQGGIPTVTNLIMIGTPNHGTELAPFRIFMEFRDQLSGLFSGNYIWLNGILDGAGEAGLDLVPGSPFLEELNSRPHPENVNIAVIAGVISGLKEEDLAQFIENVKGRLPDSAQNSVGKVGEFIHLMANGLGDGIVSVNSAKLNGFPLHVVDGDHLSIIRNHWENNERIPPAIPIVMEYLETK
jgi:pimeloyl-ACP methyl ester carboxylesterase